MHDRRDQLHSALLEETAEDLYEHAPCGYVSLLPDGIIGRVNATFLEWTDYARESLLGRVRFVDLLTVGSRVYYETHFQPLLRMQGFVREIAFDLRCSGGARLPVLVNAVQRPTDGEFITRITVFDATDRRRYERELLDARNRAETAARAKTELIAMISHDLRSPLSAILTAVSLLENMSPAPHQARYLHVLRSSSEQALALVNNVLDFSRLDSGRAPLRERDFPPRDLVDTIVAAARAAAVGKTDLEVRATVDDAVPERIVGDRAKIGQVLTNLMMNAVKFTDRGFVSLAVSLVERTDDSATLEFVVSDTGIGIPADRLPHIFEEYTQAGDDIAEKYGGTGLGLAISRKLLQLYGSEVHVTSTVGQGTTFSFALTLRCPDRAHAG
jgi:PAS domain S-box-containing protein